MLKAGRSFVACEDRLLKGLHLLLIHQVEGVGEVFGLDGISLCLHLFQIIFICILTIITLNFNLIS